MGVLPSHRRRARDRLLCELAAEAACPHPEQTARQLLILLEGATIVAALTGDPQSAADARAAARALLEP